MYFRPFDTCGADRDLLIELDGSDVGLVERRETREHLESEDTERIPVDGFVIAGIADNLGSKTSQSCTYTTGGRQYSHATAYHMHRDRVQYVLAVAVA